MKYLLMLVLLGGVAYAEDTPAEAPPTEAAPDTPPASSAAVPTSAPPAPQQPAPAEPAPTEGAATRTFFAPWQTARLVIDLELTTQARLVRRAGDDLSELRLDRGELGARVAFHRDAAAELRLETIRSAADGGALGIDGNSTIVRVKRALVGATHSFGLLRLDGALGFTPDPWLATLETDYSVKPLSRTGSERLLDWPTSDLAFVGAASIGPVRASVSVGNGEGLRYPERNTGKTITGVIQVVPLASPSARVELDVMGRDGSLGVASIREQRVVGAASLVTPWARGGIELVQAWGVRDQSDAKALLVGGWAEARTLPFLFIAARGATLAYANDGGRQSTFGGAVSVEPWADAATPRGHLRLWLAVERVTNSGAAMPLPGADAGDATLVMLVASVLAPYVVN